MAISFRAAGATATGNDPQTTMVLAVPTGTVSTDILIAVIHGGFLPGAVLGAPAGWTLVKNQADATRGSLWIYWALGDVASKTFSIDVDSVYVGFILGYIDVDNTTPIDAVATGQNNAASTTGTAPTITTVTDNAWFGCAFGFFDSLAGAPGTYTIGGGLTERKTAANQFATPGTVSIDIGDGIQTPAGATGTHTTLYSLSKPNEGITFALRPSGAPPPPSLSQDPRFNQSPWTALSSDPFNMASLDNNSRIY